MADGMPNKAWIKEKLIFNADKNFVQRLFKKDAPKMDIGDGRVATHQMSWGHTGPPGQPGTKIIVYPNIIWDKQRRGLNWLSGRDAQQHAERTKEYIEVDSEEEADLLSTHYKEAVPNFDERIDGAGSQSYQMVPSEEEKEQTKQNKIKLGLMNKPKPKEKKSGR